MDTTTQENIVLSQNESVLPELPKENQSKNNFLVILLSVLLTLSVLIAGFFAYQTQKLVKELRTLKNEPKPVVSIEPTTNPTENWKTYTNKIYNFSFKTPDYITQLIKGPSNQTKIDDSDWYFAKKDMSLVDQDHKTISPEAAIFLEVASYKDAAQENYDMHCKGNLFTFNQEKPLISNKSLVNDAEQYVQVSGIASHSTVPQVKYWESKVCFIKNGIDYEISYQNYESTDTDPTFDQILSTFKFTTVDSMVPKSISTLFDSINNNFKLSLIPVEESQFYSPSGMVTKKSWKLDLMNANLGKSLMSYLAQQLSPNDAESGGIGGGGIDAYENSKIKCFHQYMSQGPDIHDYLSCAEK